MQPLQKQQQLLSVKPTHTPQLRNHAAANGLFERFLLLLANVDGQVGMEAWSRQGRA